MFNDGINLRFDFSKVADADLNKVDDFEDELSSLAIKHSVFGVAELSPGDKSFDLIDFAGTEEELIEIAKKNFSDDYKVEFNHAVLEKKRGDLDFMLPDDDNALHITLTPKK